MLLIEKNGLRLIPGGLKERKHGARYLNLRIIRASHKGIHAVPNRTRLAIVEFNPLQNAGPVVPKIVNDYETYG